MYEKSSNHFVKHLDFILLDLLCLEAALILANYIRFGNERIMDKPEYRVSALWLLVFHLGVSLFTRSYQNILKRSYISELYYAGKHFLKIFIWFVSFLFLTKLGKEYSRLVMGYFSVVSIFSMFLVRIIWKSIVLKGKAQKERMVLVVTEEKNAQKLIQKLEESTFDLKVPAVYCLDTGKKNMQLAGKQILTNMEEMVAYSNNHVVDEVFISVHSGSMIPEELLSICRLMGLTVHQRINLHEDSMQEQSLNMIGDMSVLTSSVKMVSSEKMLLKRMMDIVGGLVGVILTAVLTVFIAPVLFLADPGPIFYSQNRIGKNGRIFRIYKFRSMYKDADARKKELMEKNEMSGHMFKMEADPRIIGSGPDGTRHGIGHFLRSTSLDEFPQFWNILKGDMSLVGTRPPTQDEWAEYSPEHKIRMAVKPGLTGMWQVSGRSDITDFDEVVRLDTEYIQRWSPLLDIQILFRTVGVVALHKGSR